MLQKVHPSLFYISLASSPKLGTITPETMTMSVFHRCHRELTAFITESEAGYNDPNCTLKEDGIGFDLSGYAFALQKNSSWTTTLSRAIHKLNAQDTIRGIFNKWSTSRCKNSQQSVVAHSMGLDEFGGFLFNTAMISVGCSLILLLEVFFYRRITNARRSFSPQQNGAVIDAATLRNVSSMTSISNN